MRIFLVVFALIFPIVTGAAERVTLVNPEPRLLKPIEVQTNAGHFAKFTGRLQIDGTLYVEWYGDGNPIADYRLIPSSKSAKKLPHFRGYRVTWIAPFDGQETLRSAIDDETFRRVVEGRLSFRVNGSWYVSNYEVGIECDAPYAYAKVVAVRSPQKIATVEAPETC